jgi:hypothetical protein
LSVVTREPDRTVEQLTGVLIRALRALGVAGQPVAASRLAAEAWSATRHDHARSADRINGVMHHLARLESETPDPRSIATMPSSADRDRPAG